MCLSKMDKTPRGEDHGFGWKCFKHTERGLRGEFRKVIATGKQQHVNLRCVVVKEMKVLKGGKK